MTEDFTFTTDGKGMSLEEETKINKFKSEIIEDVEAHTNFKARKVDEGINSLGLSLEDTGDHELTIYVNDDADAIVTIDFCDYDEWGDASFKLENKEDMKELSNLLIVLSKYLKDTRNDKDTSKEDPLRSLNRCLN